MTQDQRSKRYSEAFKRQVVKEYEDGASVSHLRKKHGIGGSMTITKWAQKYGKGRKQAGGFGGTRGSGESRGEAPESEGRVALLEKAIAGLTVENLVLKEKLKVYQEEYGMGLVKKNGQRSLRGSTERQVGS